MLQLIVALVLSLGCHGVAWGASLDLDRLDPSTIQVLREAVERLEPLVAERRAAGRLPLLTLEELYAPLTREQRALLDAIRAVPPESLQGSSRRLPSPRPHERFHRIPPKTLPLPDGKTMTLSAQYLPERVYEAYAAMMSAMERDLGRRLYVESGYRSPAHQLYLFCSYLPKHGHSIRETNRLVALPGCSEHGSPARQAIDFINAQGINGEDDPEAFERLPEYAWLQRHARRFGFFLSYPRTNTSGTSFEPWHWHYEAKTSTATR